MTRLSRYVLLAALCAAFAAESFGSFARASSARVEETSLLTSDGGESSNLENAESSILEGEGDSDSDVESSRTLGSSRQHLGFLARAKRATKQRSLVMAFGALIAMIVTERVVSSLRRKTPTSVSDSADFAGEVFGQETAIQTDEPLEIVEPEVQETEDEPIVADDEANKLADQNTGSIAEAVEGEKAEEKAEEAEEEVYQTAAEEVPELKSKVAAFMQQNKKIICGVAAAMSVAGLAAVGVGGNVGSSVSGTFDQVYNFVVGGPVKEPELRDQLMGVWKSIFGL